MNRPTAVDRSGSTDVTLATEASPPARKKAWRDRPDRVAVMRANPALSAEWLAPYLAAIAPNLSGIESPEQIALALDLAGCPRWMRDDAVKAVTQARDVQAAAPVLQRRASFGALPSASPIGYSCRYCGSPAQAHDHVWPRARGGDDHPNNLVPACSACNTSKGSQSWLTERCPNCDGYRDPGDVETSTGRAFYACRCGTSWVVTWDLQHGVASRRARPSGW